jgi:hypothetical protein
MHTKKKPFASLVGPEPLPVFLFDTNISVQYHLEKIFSSDIRTIMGVAGIFFWPV